MERFFAIGLAVLTLAGCDQNRYELGKDPSGNMIRLDRRTGETAMVKGGAIHILKDAAQVEAERKKHFSMLELSKRWGGSDIAQIGARFTLTTSWRDGKMHYEVQLKSLEVSRIVDEWLDRGSRGEIPVFDTKRREAALLNAMRYQPFVLELYTANQFRLFAIKLGELKRVPDSDGTASHFETKNSLEMSEDDYVHIIGWQVASKKMASGPQTK